MAVPNPIEMIARSSRIVMTTLVILLIVAIAQTFALEIMQLFLWNQPPAPKAPAATREQTAEEKTIGRIFRSRKEFLPDGTLHLVTEQRAHDIRTSQPSFDAPTEVIEVYDVNNTLLWAGPPKESPYHYLSWAQNTRRYGFPPASMKLVRQISPDACKTLDIPVASAEHLMAVWRYDAYYDCFVGYDLSDGRIGYLSAEGLTDTVSDTQPFGAFHTFLAWWPIDAYGPTFLWQTARHIYQIDFDHRQVAPVIEIAGGTIARMDISQWDGYRPRAPQEHADGRSLLDVVTHDNIHYLVLRDPNEIIKIAPPEQWNKWIFNQIEFAATDQALFMRRIWTEYPQPTMRTDPNWLPLYLEATKWQWVELYQIDAAGNLELINQYRWKMPAQPVEQVRYAIFNLPSYVNAFSPLAYDLLWSGLLAAYQGNPLGADNSLRVFAQFVSTVRPGCGIWAWLVTGVMMVLTFLHARVRSASWGRLVFWLVVVGLFNSVGFLSYWALNHTPTIKCPNCGRRRDLDRANCPRCRAPLPVPEHGPRDLVLGI